MSADRHVLGVDVGGTFTDLALVRVRDGLAHHHKTPSTPHDPAEAVARGIETLLASAGVDPASVAYFGHGTTVATNAVIQGRTAPTALLTTAGFRDLLEIRRQRQPHSYDLRRPKPAALVPRRLRLEIAERAYLFGREDVAPDLDGLAAIAAALEAEGVAAVAVCFLHAYRKPAHEARVAEALRALLPGVFVCASHEVMAEFREYERLSTTALNASLGPVMARYLTDVAGAARGLGIAEPRILQSNGGVASARETARIPVRTLASGPAAGVSGAARLALAAGHPDIITFDVGGTSTDVCLVDGGEALLAREREVNGYPVRFPMLDVHSVGAGGGSIAWVDDGGFLHVGPQSAGANPGPACYGLGGEAPTVTDANVVLGRLPPDALLGGRMPIDAGAARRALEVQVARPMGLSVEAAAEGVLTLLNESMLKAIRVISVEQGFDPRRFTLAAFGGAGPLLAAGLAAELGMGRVLVPADPGLLCAQGLLTADLRADFSRTRLVDVGPEAGPAIDAELGALVGAATDWFEREGVAPPARRFERSLDMRYAGQSHELNVAVGEETHSGADPEVLAEAFRREHERVYGYARRAPVQVVTFRVSGRSRVVADAERAPPVDAGAAPVAGERPCHFAAAGGFLTCPVYARERLGPGLCIEGPAIVEQMDTTTVVPPGWTLGVDGHGNLLLTRDGG